MTAAIVEVRDSPGRGKGLFAIQDLAAGDLVVQENPVITVTMIHDTLDRARDTIYENIMRQWKALPREEQDQLATLHVPKESQVTRMHLGAFKETFPGVKPAPIKAVAQRKGWELALPVLIFYANNYGYSPGLHKREKQGLYPLTSRINHSCDPNLQFLIDSRGVMFIRAARAIKKDQELTLSYQHSWFSSFRRQENCKVVWGFECDCSRCLRDKDGIPVAEIPGLGSLCDFVSRGPVWEAALEEGVDFNELWFWMKIQTDRIVKGKKKQDFKALSLPYRQMGEALIIFAQKCNNRDLLVRATEFWNKAARNADEWYSDSPVFGEFLRNQARELEKALSNSE